MDDVETVFERLQYEEEGLGFIDEHGNLVRNDAGVRDVLVEKQRRGERDGLEGREQGADEVGQEGVGLRGFVRDIVEDALGPASCGEDDVDGTANVRVELLEVVGGRASCLNEPVELESEFVAGGKG